MLMVLSGRTAVCPYALVARRRLVDGGVYFACLEGEALNFGKALCRKQEALSDQPHKLAVVEFGDENLGKA